MRKLYVAGAYRDPRGGYFVIANILAAREVAAVWWQRGWAVFTPHLNTAGFDSLVPDGAFLEADLEFLRCCEAIVMVPGWERSTGATAELAEARRLGLEVFFHDRDEEPRLPGREETTP